MDIKRPLEGIRVVEFANYVAAPSAGRLLTDWGAEVIRVESFKGDVWRFYGPTCNCPATPQENPIFDIYNANKKDILLDTKNEEGKQILFRLLDHADVFLTNNRPKALAKAGLDYDSLKDRYPRLVYAMLTGYGQSGPDCDAPGYDGVAFFSRSGFLADLSDPSGYPLNPPGGFGGAATGSVLFGGICAALLAREKTGKGDFVETSLYGNATWLVASVMAFEQYGYKYPKKRESMNPIYNCYRCNDGEWIQLAILEYDRFFKPLCRILGLPEIAEDPRFNVKKNMLANRQELIPMFEEAFAHFSSSEISEQLKKADIVFDRMRHFRELPTDEQALANDHVREITFESGNKAVLAMTPLKSRNIGQMPYKRGPLMGEHTDEIMRSIGYSEEEIKKFKESGAIK